MMLAYLFVIFAVLARMPFMPHPWGFTPVAAALLYFGARGSRRQLWVPFGLMITSDVLLNKFVYAYPLSWDQPVVWAWYAAILLLGTQLHENSGWLRVAGAALASSVSFFILSDLAVWPFGTMYPKPWSGLVGCYVPPLSFFRAGLGGDSLSPGVMWGCPPIPPRFARHKPHGAAAA